MRAMCYQHATIKEDYITLKPTSVESTFPNRCSGCTRCSCSVNREWNCKTVNECENTIEPIGDENLEIALDELQRALLNKKSSAQLSAQSETQKRASNNKKIEILDDNDDEEINLQIDASLNRKKRSLESTTQKNIPKRNGTIIFHNVVDELNEDTLKRLNYSGTISIAKVKGGSSKIIENTSRSSSSDINSLHIGSAKSDPNHIKWNKLESNSHDQALDKLSHDKLQVVLHNQSQETKDKDLSKLIVNELKKGSEVIGDVKAPKVSNITFMPENNNLTAVATIAGNLLNKLWTMEKDRQDSKELAGFQHPKIADLLELFKEPLTIRQGKFLKTAMDTLVQAVDKNKDIDSVSICEKMEEAKKKFASTENLEDKLESNGNTENQSEKNRRAEKKVSKLEAINKVKNVVELIKKMENVNTRLYNFQRKDDELNLFGKILQKMTNLLFDDKNKKTPPLKTLHAQQLYKKNSGVILDKIKDLIDIDLDISNLTAKDKLVFDYLTKIEENPEKFLGIKAPSSKSKIQGNSIDQLLDLIKVKSFVDLLKLINNEKSPPTTTTTTAKPDKAQRRKSNLANAKDKLKKHLISILEDLSELKSESGSPLSKVDINNLLPCVSNILNDDNATDINTGENIDIIDKMRNVFISMKKDAKVVPSRRNLKVFPKERPQSAKVLERVVKELNDLTEPKTRRSNNVNKQKLNLDEALEGLEETKSQITPAAIALVPPAEQLTLYRTLHMNVKRYITILENLISSLDSDRNMRANNDKISDLVDNAISNIELNIKFANKINENRRRNYSVSNSDMGQQEMSQKKTIITYDSSQSNFYNESQNMSQKENKISRDMIMSQLIRNRAERYIKNCETYGFGQYKREQYNIAKRIISSLDNGNFTLANELYMIFSLSFANTHSAVSSGDMQMTNDQKRTSTLQRQVFIRNNPSMQMTRHHMIHF